MPAERVGKVGLRHCAQALRRRRRTIVLAALLATIPTVVLSLLQTPVYAARAELLVLSPSDIGLNRSGGIRTDPSRAVRNEIRILTSQPVRTAVRAELGSAPKVSATADGQTDLIRVEAKSTDPRRAADVANTYSTAYIEYRRKQAVDEVLAASQLIQEKVADLQKQIDVATGAAREPLLQAQTAFKQERDRLQVEAALPRDSAQLVTPAAVPSSPVSPRPLRSGIAALIVGLGVGVAVALALELLDDSVKTKDDLERVTSGLPVLGLIPIVPAWKAKEAPLLVSLADPSSPASEAYRTLRTSIQFRGLEHPMRILQVTSANPRDGRTTTVANLAVALARSGQTVAIVCGDLRRPRVHEFFGLSNEIGFTSVLLGKVPLVGAMQEVPDQSRLSLLASGPLPPNPSELLASRRTVEVFGSLQAEYDIVVLDCPPVLPVTDALVLSNRVDATLLVAVAGATARKDAARAVELLSQVGAPLVGTVLNGVDTGGSYGQAYDNGGYRNLVAIDSRRRTEPPPGGSSGLPPPSSTRRPISP